MGKGRRFRTPGEIIKLGEIEYQIGSVEGFGGSSVVYRAKYEDRLNLGCYHQVLIKELFPYHPRDFIYRGEDGFIRCREEGRELMEDSRKRFYQGNQANLELLARFPERMSGNLDSFQAYGTYYSVLAVHGGTNLEEFLEARGESVRLREAAELMIQLLDALECFHQLRILHLDISPDNILLLSGHALLIDYNSVCPMDRNRGERFAFSVKDGYSAPEVYLRQEEEIGVPADLYSVCAVCFRILTGRCFRNEDAAEKGLKRCFPKDLRIFRGEPVTAARKAVQIVSKGLHVLPQRRYQSAAELRREMEELMLRIDKAGISGSSFWESSRESFQRHRNGQEEEAYLERRLLLDGGRIYPQKECLEMLTSGARILLKGPGGMGKTSLLINLWERGIRKYPCGAIVIYIPLADYQQTRGEAFYIHKYLLHRLGYSGQTENTEGALLELNRYLSGCKAAQDKVILLLDGLNEAGSRRKLLIREIEELGKLPGVGILVTDRSDCVKQYGLYEFQTAEILPLTEQEVSEQIKKDHLPEPKESEMLELLKTPMMLSLYRRAMIMEKETGKKSVETALGNTEDIIFLYLDRLHVQTIRKESGSQAGQLRSGYLLRQLLPEIALEMRKRKKTVLSAKELFELVERSRKRLQKKAFSMAFPEYLGKSRPMLADFAGSQEWFDYAVSEQLTDQMNLLERSEEGYFRLVHDGFIECLSELGQKNKKRYRRYCFREYGGKKGVCAVIVLCMLLGFWGWKHHDLALRSQQEQEAVRGATQRLIINLQILAMEIDGQQQILSKAYEEELLDGDLQASQELAQLIEKKKGSMERYQVMVSDGAGWVEKLEMLKFDIPLSTLQSLYERPYELSKVSADAMEHLEQSLCSQDSPYFDREKRKPLVDAYAAYLDAYLQVCYLELDLVLLGMDQEEADTLLDSLAQLSAYQEYILTHSLSGQIQEQTKRKLEAAMGRLQQAKEDMQMQNFKMED